MAERRRFGIGYALAPKKRESFIQESLLRLGRERGLDLVPIDTTRPLADQGPFDCVLHKLYGDDWNAQLQDFKTRNPNSTVLDAPDSIARLHNRISMLQAVSELNIDTNTNATDSPSFGIPNQIVIYDMDALHHDHAWDRLKFPVIAKPLVADGTAKSHKMALVFNRDGFTKLKPPIVLQEFVNHGGVIFKVYVVGDYVKCMKRKSLPDVSEEKLASLEGSLSFSQVSNMTNERNNAKYCEIMKLYDTEMPPQSFITDIARGLRRAMKLNLFNFDVIRDVRIGNRYLVIDINYFPGYAKMPCYETVLTDFLWDVVNKKERVLLKGKCGEEGGATERLVHSCDREVRKVTNSSCCSDGEDKETVIKV